MLPQNWASFILLWSVPTICCKDHWRIPSTTYWKQYCESSEFWQTHRLNMDRLVPLSVFQITCILSPNCIFKMTYWDLFMPVRADKSNIQEPLVTCNAKISLLITFSAICWTRHQPIGRLKRNNCWRRDYIKERGGQQRTDSVTQEVLSNPIFLCSSVRIEVDGRHFHWLQRAFIQPQFHFFSIYRCKSNVTHDFHETC